MATPVYPLSPSDLSDDEWALLSTLIPSAKPGGRPRSVEVRRILTGIFYVRRSGCAWRSLPREYGPWPTVYKSVFALLPPNQDGGDGDHRQEVDREFLVPCRHPAELLEPIDAALHAVALPIELPVKGALRALVALGRDGAADAMLAQVAADCTAAVALVADEALGASARPTSPARTLDGSCLQERDEDALLVALTSRQQQGEGLAVPLGADVELGGEAASAPPERLLVLPPLTRRAPAACWWARMLVVELT